MLGINGTRSSLYTYIVKAVDKIKPKVFIAENVGGLLLKQNEASLKKSLKIFRLFGMRLAVNDTMPLITAYRKRGIEFSLLEPKLENRNFRNLNRYRKNL